MSTDERMKLAIDAFKACRPVDRGMVCQDFGMQQDDILEQQLEAVFAALRAPEAADARAVAWQWRQYSPLVGEWSAWCVITESIARSYQIEIDAGRQDVEIRALAPTAAGIAAPPADASAVQTSVQGLLYLADQQASARQRYAEDDAGLIRESKVIEWALRRVAAPPAASADAAREALELCADMLEHVKDAYNVPDSPAINLALKKAAAALSAPIAGADAGMRERAAKVAETAGCNDPACTACVGNQVAAAIRALPLSPDAAPQQ